MKKIRDISQIRYSLATTTGNTGPTRDAESSLVPAAPQNSSTASVWDTAATKVKKTSQMCDLTNLKKKNRMLVNIFIRKVIKSMN